MLIRPNSGDHVDPYATVQTKAAVNKNGIPFVPKCATRSYSRDGDTNRNSDIRNVSRVNDSRGTSRLIRPKSPFRCAYLDLRDSNTDRHYSNNNTLAFSLTNSHNVPSNCLQNPGIHNQRSSSRGMLYGGASQTTAEGSQYSASGVSRYGMKYDDSHASQQTPFYTLRQDKNLKIVEPQGLVGLRNIGSTCFMYENFQCTRVIS